MSMLIEIKKTSLQAGFFFAKVIVQKPEQQLRIQFILRHKKTPFDNSKGVSSYCK